MAAQIQKPWKAEYAKSSRSTCKTCKKNIEKDSFRIAKMVPATQFDGFMPMWNHAGCVLKKKGQFQVLSDVEGVDSLRWEDQQLIRNYLENSNGKSASGKNDSAQDDEYSIEYAKSGRATCNSCGGKIEKGKVRIATMVESDNARYRGKISVWHHANCFLDLGPLKCSLENFSGWENIKDEDKKDVQSAALQYKCTSTEDQLMDGPHSEGLKKRKLNVSESVSDRKPKIIAQKGISNISDTKELDEILERQSKELWKIKDELQRNVRISELREMLDINGQVSSGSEYNVRERCADGMLFGILKTCPICGGGLEFSDGQYKCTGYISAWSKCTFGTSAPERLKGKWKIPDGTDNEYLIKWFKNQKVGKPIRVLPQKGSTSAVEVMQGSHEMLEKFLYGLSIVMAPSKDYNVAWKKRTEAAGGKLLKSLTQGVDCLIVNENEIGASKSLVEKAMHLRVPVLRESFLADCFTKRKRLPMNRYQIEESSKSDIVKVKVKGRSSVHEESGLQECGHILEEGEHIYNTTLNMSDLSTGINSYYVLQIIEDDKKAVYHLFRKWGRVGNNKIGGQKLEKLSKKTAILEFQRLFMEKTANEWENWVRKEHVEKHPGKFFPLEIDYGADRSHQEGVQTLGLKSKLDVGVVDLLKMLFDIETYRAAMMEFEINLSEMPLGKLSKNNIQKGFKVLTELQNLILNKEYHAEHKNSLIVDASNRFFTLIPNIHPHLIQDEDELKAKIEMLETLSDIEIASGLVSFDNDSEDPLDANYRKLHCNISPLPHDNSDYQLVKKYLESTHAPTHKEWSLELEDVFAIDREGESEAYASFKNKIQNRMLLWHGSRITNFVGILSQGLRIAPPEAPATGYMFGKGIYFADLVSKSAQYCYTQKANPVGLMLLSEVALGDVYELKSAEYMDEPPDGKNSTKGVGKTKPLESEFENWADNVTVPCGRPVRSGVRNSDMLYNEYIVYDPKQVKLQFLLKVRFHHKR